jgi:hypothetical protein
VTGVLIFITRDSRPRIVLNDQQATRINPDAGVMPFRRVENLQNGLMMTLV